MFTYYSYLDKFHVIPETWKDLFEFLRYRELTNNIDKLVYQASKEENTK